MRVLHLVGSPTSEFFADLSRLYARDCLNAVAGRNGYEHLIAYVTPDGTWRFPTSLDDLDAAPVMDLPGAIGHLVALAPDVAVPQMFCLPGMTTYRALLEVLDIPYAGNRPHVMAAGAYKPHASAIVAGAGVGVPASQVLRCGDEPSLALPVVVKPADADNSVGVTLVRDGARLDGALEVAFAHSSEVLVERYVELGREVRCGVLERDGWLVVLPLEEYAVDPDRKPVRDAADKLARRPDGELALVAKDAAHAWIVDPADPVCRAVGEAALAAYRALGCRHYGLFDFRVDPDGRPWFLEAGLYCSFARQSVLAVMAAAAGIEVGDLFDSAVRQALGEREGSRHEHRNR